MSSIQQNLYFIAVIIPAPISEEITSYKQDVSMRYHSKAALRVVPHITLKTPMRLPAAWHETLLQWFQSLSISISPFQQDIDGFGTFNNKKDPVIYAHPVVTTNSPLLQLQKEIISHFQKSRLRDFLIYFDNVYLPHITIAYRDLSIPDYQQAWQEYEAKSYQAFFAIKSFHLLQHNGKIWQPISEYHLPM